MKLILMRNLSSVRLLIIIILTGPILSAQYYFGRNKIQYEKFNWQVMATDHFDIYFYGSNPLVYSAAFWVEDTYNELEQKFNYTLNHRVPLVIYNSHIHFQQTNVLPMQIPEGIGGFFEFIKGRVVLPFNGNLHDFRHVLRHELVHVFMQNKVHSYINDVGVQDNYSFPLWFTEGLAEWWSIGWDSQAEMLIRDALLHDHLYPLGSLDLAMTGFLMYKQGQSFLRYYEQQYGADRLRKIMEDFLEFDTFDETISAISGKDFREIMIDWELALKRETAKALQHETVPGSGIQQLTRRGSNVNPSMYRDSDGELHTIYFSNRDGFTNIYTQDIEDKKESVLVRGERTTDLESLHFLRTGLSVNKSGILAFAVQSGQRDMLKLIDLETQQTTGEFSHPKLVMIRSPKWSPSGKQIVFSAQNYDGQSDLYFWQPSTDYVIQLTNDMYDDVDPCFTDDEDMIIFSSDRGAKGMDGAADLFLMRISTKEIWFLTNDEYSNTKPIYSTNKKRHIYYISDRSGTPNVWSLSLSNIIDKHAPNFAHHKQITALHTGVLDVVPFLQDSLLVTLFQKYSFQLHQLAASSLLSSVVDSNFVSKESAPWTVPAVATSPTVKITPYRLKYNLDFAQTAVAYDPIFGFLGGAQLSISDILGNKYYHILLANTSQTTGEFMDRFNVAVTMVNLTKRTNWALGVFHFANDYWDPYQMFYFERSIGLRAGMNHPFDLFKRLEFSGSLWYSRKDFYFGDRVSALLLSNYISLVHDNSLWTPIGPIDGWSLRLTIGPTFDFQRSKLHNYAGLLDFRYYYRINHTFSIAQRSMVWLNDGSDIRRFYIGGSWGLRGYGLNQIYGRKAMLLNQELRFPFAKSLMLNIGTENIGFAPIRGALFLDAGNAWDYSYPGLRGSFGFGLRGLFMGGIVLRIDIGKQTDFRSISEDWFTQFFFGWDF